MFVGNVGLLVKNQHVFHATAVFGVDISGVWEWVFQEFGAGRQEPLSDDRLGFH